MEAGAALGHYRIVDKLGEGGMGAVYRAEDTRLKREVAIKVLPPELAADQERLARMEREAQVLAALDHPNIAAIYGLEEAEGVRFLVMQLAEGATLADRIASGPIPLEEALPIALSISEALEAAHARGIVHRDLKPANIQIGADGKVTLLDFGLAKVYEQSVSDSSEHKTLAESPTYVQATQAGVILGTAPYMSPEQARGQEVDARSDIWAYGCVFYEMLGGDAAFAGPTVTDVLGSIVHKDPDWDTLPKRTPRRIRMVMHRCLRKDPVRRLQAIGDARIAIQEYLEDPRSVEAILEAPPATSLLQRAAPWAVAAVAVAAAMWLYTGSSGGSGETAMRVDVALDADPLFTGVGSGMALSPDGTHVVYSVGTPSGMALRARSLVDGRTTELASGESTYQPFLSPSGDWVGFVTREGLHRVPITGGTPITVTAVRLARGAAWGPNDEMIFSPSPDEGLFAVASTGGEVREFTSLADGEITHRWPQVLSDGRVIFTSHSSTGGFDTASVDLFDPATQQRDTLVRGGYFGRYLEELGVLVYVNSGTLFGLAVDLDAPQSAASPMPLIVDLTVTESEGSAQIDYAPGGRIVYSLGGSEEAAYPVLWVDAVGRADVLWGESKPFGEPKVSPDGTKISLIALEDDNWDVWVYDLERDVATRLTFDPGIDAPGIWSPDGDYVMFSSPRDGEGYNVYRKPADGSGEVERMTEEGWDSFAYDWSVNGDVVLRHRGDLWVMNVDTGQQPEPYFETPDFIEQEAQFSPDGRWITYMSNESGRNEIYVRPFPLAGGKWQISANGGAYPQWSADGTRLFFRTDDGIMAATVQANGTSFRAGRPTEVFTGEFRGGMNGLSVGGFTAADFAPHPDGTRFVMFPSDEDQSLGVQLISFETRWFDKVRNVLGGNR